MQIHFVRIAFALAALISPPAEAQWVGISPIYYNTGDVGIGTAFPNIRLEVANMGSPYNLYLSGFAPSLYFGGTSGIFPNSVANNATGFMAFATAAGNYGMGAGDMIFGTQSFQPGNSNAMRFVTPYNDSGTYQPVMSILKNGNVGIGATAPSAPLHVLTSDTGLLIQGTSASAAASLNVNSYNPGSPAQGMFIIQSRTPGNGYLNNWFTINLANGNTGIGTTAPQYPLSVNGIIQAKEVLVNTNWSDYVFDPGYRLAPLSEVADYVRENRHLPDIPSAAEVAEKGISMGEMQSKLLAKIEELMLHMIEAERENRELKERLGRLEQRR